jgi:hypothetical protein
VRQLRLPRADGAAWSQDRDRCSTTVTDRSKELTVHHRCKLCGCRPVSQLHGLPSRKSSSPTHDVQPCGLLAVCAATGSAALNGGCLLFATRVSWATPDLSDTVGFQVAAALMHLSWEILQHLFSEAELADDTIAMSRQRQSIFTAGQPTMYAPHTADMGSLLDNALCIVNRNVRPSTKLKEPLASITKSAPASHLPNLTTFVATSSHRSHSGSRRAHFHQSWTALAPPATTEIRYTKIMTRPLPTRGTTCASCLP